MNCPRCTTPLSPILYEGVEIDTCPTCQGEWLDAGELQQIVRTVERTFTPEEIDELDALRQATFRVEAGGAQRVRCPRCPRQRLEPFNYAGNSGVILDKCPACGGIWLDHRELEMVQALVEEWNGQLRGDAARFGVVLHKIRRLTEVETQRGQTRTRTGLVMTVLRAFR